MHAPDPRVRTGWRIAIAIGAAILALRLMMLLASGLGLSADEAHYWEWSRRLDWSYPTKGPGIAYAIAGARALFGDEAWAIRSVPVLSASIMLLLGFGLARAAARHLEPPERTRAALWGVALLALFPAFQITSLLATIDAPYLACWIGAAWAGLALQRRLEDGRPPLGPAALLGITLGLGALFKYTILLLLPSLLLVLALRRRRLVCWKRTTLAVLTVLATMLITAAPIIVWNAREGWPTIAHLLGHLGAPGGDVPTAPDDRRAWTPMWAVEFIGSQIGLAGPFLMLMLLGLRTRQDDRDPARPWLIVCAAPILLVYLLVSLLTDAEANWPIAGYTTLLVLAAVSLPRALDVYRERLRSWRALDAPRPKQGVFRRAPETAWQLSTHWSLGYAGALALATLLLPVAVRTPLGETGALDRLQRSERLGATVLDAMDRSPAPVGLIITDRYTSASRLAYELHRAIGDEAPIVTSGASLVGDRRSAYDYWPETDPRRVETERVLFVGGQRDRKWTRRFEVATIVPMLDEPDPIFGQLFYATGYRGPIEVER